MRLGFDAKRLFHNATGLGNYSRTLIRNLFHYFPKNEYHLYAPKPIPAHPFFQSPPFSIHHNQFQPASIWRSTTQSKQWTQAGIQLYHGLSNELPFYGHSDCKTVVTIHDLIFKTLPQTYPFIDRWMYDKKVKASCEEANLIIAISQHTKTDLCTYYNINPEKIEVIYQAVANEFYDTLSPLSKSSVELPSQYFLCVGTLEERKNQLQILKAWEQLDTSLQLPIVLIGKGKTYARQLKNYAHEKKIPVQFLDNITHQSDLQSIYQKATLFIYPSLYEGFGLPIVEAQLSNIPVITSNVSAMKEAANPQSILINPASTEELAEAIRTILSDQESYNKRIVEGRQFAENHFHPQVLSEQMMLLYQKLLS